MHELAIGKSILRLAVDRATAAGCSRITAIHLVIGELRNIEESMFQRYFDQISAGSIAEGARLCVTRGPIRFACRGCGLASPVVICNACGADCELAGGREMLLERLEATG